MSRVIGNEMDEAEDTFDKVGDSTNIVINVTDNDWIYPEPEEVGEGESDGDDADDDVEDDRINASTPGSEGVEMVGAADGNRKND